MTIYFLCEAEVINSFQDHHKLSKAQARCLGEKGGGEYGSVVFKNRCLKNVFASAIPCYNSWYQTHSCIYHTIIVKVMCGQMVAVFGGGHNTAFLTSDERIDVVQTEHHCTWPTARQPHVLPSCHLTEGSHAEQKVDSFSQ